MKKLFTKTVFLFMGMMLMGGSAWADRVTYSPTLEYNLRPKADGNGFDGKKEANNSNQQFEVNHNARFFAVQEYEVENLAFATSITLNLWGNSSWGTDALAIWVAPKSGDAWTSSTSAASTNTFYKETTGLLPGTAGTSTSTYLLLNNASAKGANDANSNQCSTFVINGDALQTLKDNSVKGKFQLIISNNTGTINGNINAKRHYYSSGCATESYRPTLDVVVEDVKDVYNKTSMTGYDDLAEAVASANADDILMLNNDVKISGSRLEIKKALTIQGTTGSEKLICGVAANSLMILANDNTVNYEVVLKNLTVDGNNTVRSTQMIDSNNKASLVFDGVSIINSAYSVNTADVKSNGGNVILKNNNSFCNGIYLNKNKRIDAKSATNTAAIPVILADDYVNDYAVILNCTDKSKFNMVDKSREFYVSGNELKSRIISSYDLSVSEVGVATLVLPFDATIPGDVEVFTLSYTGENTVTATPVSTTLANNTPVYVKAEQGTYTFTAVVGGTKASAYQPKSGALTGTYRTANVPAESYILFNGSEGVGFYKSNNSTVAPFRCYLTAENAPANLRINFGEATGISEVQSSTAKVRGAECFNLNGQRVSNSSKGIVIINGKKFINK